MDAIRKMLQAYDRDPDSLSAPDISRNLRDWLRGLVSAEQVDSRHSNPLFAYGSDKTFRCRNEAGEEKTIMLWGNTDGWGMLERKS